MKVSDLFESVITEKVDAGLSAVFPKQFINKVFKKFMVDAATKPVILAKKPTLDDIKKGVVLSKGNDGEFYAIGYFDYMYTKGGEPIVFTTDTDSDVEGYKDAIKLFKTGTYYMLPYSSSAKIRAKVELENGRTKVADAVDSVLEYMDDVYGKQLKKLADKYITDIYSKLRGMKNVSDAPLSKTDQQVALDKAAAIERLANDGFNRKSIDVWLKANKKGSFGTFGSVPANYEAFVELMNNVPASKAKFAKALFQQVKDLHAEATGKA